MGEMEGMSVVKSIDDIVHIVFMNKSKPDKIIEQDNQKENIKKSSDYKNLMNFYEFHKEKVDYYLKNKDF